MLPFVYGTNSGSTENTFTLPSINLNNGLLELSALTTLIGAGVAASLALGTRGAAGLPWAGMSAFGSIGVIRACFSGAAPGWLRDTLGLRSAMSDLAVGMDLELNGSRASKVRKHLGAPLAVVCDARESQNGEGRRPRPRSWRDVHAFDHATTTLLSRLPDLSPSTHLRIFTYAQYNFLRLHDTRFQICALGFSLVKLSEFYVLFTYDAQTLAFVSTLPWLYFFLCGAFMETRELIDRWKPEVLPGNLDIVAGHLPSVSHEGGSRKVILGAVYNSRKSAWWRIIWVFGAAACASSLVIMYFILGNQPQEVTFIWAGFQAVWLVARILVYHLGEPVDPLGHRGFTERPFSTLPSDMKLRVLELTLAVSRYQVHVHPRGEYSYKEDSSSLHELAPLLTSATSHTHYPFLPQRLPLSSKVKVDIKAVVGDTTLSSALWMMGKSKLTPMDVYDCCIIIFTLPSSISKGSHSEPLVTVAIPAVRVLAGRSMVAPDVDDMEKDPHLRFIPKGSSNLGFGISWWYWIPCESGLWLQIHTEDDVLTVTGRRDAMVLTDEQVTNRLIAGDLNISLVHVEDVKEVIKVCRTAKDSLLEFLY